MNEEKKVNLFIVGAMKAGTTSFVEMLSEHSDIYVPPIKEPHYFVDRLPENLYEPSRFFDLDSYLEKDFPKPLHITKIDSETQYNKAYSLAATEKYLVDASTAYLHAPKVAEKIYSYNSEAKIIILLRDPLKRAYSHHKMDLGLGRTRQTFETLLTDEISKYHANTLPWHSYLGMSFYSRSLKNFHNRFKNVLVLKMEDLVVKPQSVLDKVCNFLEIPSFIIPKGSQKNVSRSLKFQKLFFFLKKLGLKDYFSKWFGPRTKQKLFRLSSKEAPSTVELSEDLKQKVQQIFKLESTL